MFVIMGAAADGRKESVAFVDGLCGSSVGIGLVTLTQTRHPTLPYERDISLNEGKKFIDGLMPGAAAKKALNTTFDSIPRTVFQELFELTAHSPDRAADCVISIYVQADLGDKPPMAKQPACRE